MSYGVFINGQRPKSKKQVLEAMKADPASVLWQNDAIMGPHAGEMFQGDELPGDISDTFCGPDPHTSRKFYGQIITTGGKVVLK